MAAGPGRGERLVGPWRTHGLHVKLSGRQPCTCKGRCRNVSVLGVSSISLLGACLAAAAGARPNQLLTAVSPPLGDGTPETALLPSIAIKKPVKFADRCELGEENK